MTPRTRRQVAGIGLTLVLVLARGIPVHAARADWTKLLRQPDSWYRGEAGQRAVANVLSRQSERGAWPKNIDTTATPFEGERSTIQGTWDNGATTGEMRFLARAFTATQSDPARAAVLRALDQILKAQYANGGWPQYDPPGTKYNRYITYNDNAMVALLELLREVGDGTGDFAFVDDARRASARRAVARGIECILDTQVIVDGKKTVWCAQHDDVTLEPRPARSFEPKSLSGGESAGILVFLMSLEDPSPRVVAAIEAGTRWYDKVQLRGIRQVSRDGDKIIEPDPSAPPLWARFHEIGTNRPLFSGRDGIVKYELAAIEKERRTGYAWYGNWGEKVAKAHAKWKARRER